MSDFDAIMTDRVSLVRMGGQTQDNIPASVKKGAITICPERDQLPIEDGDALVRKLSNGITEEYLVLDSGYHEEFHGALPPRYRCSVQKKTAISRTPPQVVYNLGDINVTGANARFNLHSHDTSQNIVDIGAEELFTKLRDSIEANIEDEEKRFQLLSHAAAMKKVQGTPIFTERYKEFVEVAADRLTLLSPFIPALTQLIPQV